MNTQSLPVAPAKSVGAGTSSSAATYREALFRAMDEGLGRNPNAVIMGQGIDDHKGTFGTTIGLHKKHGANRVFDIPLMEEGAAGIALGAALNGVYPIQTHIRADFALLAMNQIINLAAKYRYMFGGRFKTPMLIRMVVGRSWGQGAQHSQSLQSLFAHIPGLTVIMPAHPAAILESYRFAIEKYENPVVSIEHRLMYDLSFADVGGSYLGANPLHSSHLVRQGKDITIAAASIMVVEAVRAADYLKKVAGIECDVVDLHSASHPDKQMVIDSVRRTGRLLVADTSWAAYGVRAEVCRWIAESDPGALKLPVRTIGMAPAPCPTAKTLEDLYYPNLHTLCEGIAQMVRGAEAKSVPLPTEASMTEGYKKFKGPF